MSGILFIAGMHRSGTSALSGSTRLVGAMHMDDLIAPKKANAKGFFESRAVVRANDDMLRDLARTWNDCREMPAIEVRQRAAYVARLEHLLRNSRCPDSLLVVKDPRISLLPGLWNDAAQGLGCTPRFLVAVRDPASSACSIVRRDGLSEEAAVAIWLRYMLDAEKGTRGRRRAFVAAEQFVTDPVATLEHLEGVLGLRWPLPPQERRAELSNFVEPQLMSPPGEIKSDLMLLAQSTHAAFQKLVNSPDDAGSMLELDEIRKEFAPLSEETHVRMVVQQLRLAIERNWQIDRLKEEAVRRNWLTRMISRPFFAYAWKPLIKRSRDAVSRGVSLRLRPVVQTRARPLRVEAGGRAGETPRETGRGAS